MKVSLIPLILLMIFSAGADARNCKKGKPCGNSCIAWNRTCHVGGGSYSPAPRPSVPRATIPAVSAPAAAAITAPAIAPSSSEANRASLSASQGEKLPIRMPRTDAAFILDAPSRSANRIRRLSMEDSFSIYQTTGEWVRVSPLNAAPEWVLDQYLTP